MSRVALPPPDLAANTDWRPLVGRSLLALAIAVCAWISVLARSFRLDDALIYHRCVRNLLEGNGLVYNPGEAFNALTSPLFTVLSAAASLVVGDVQRGSMVLASTLAVLTIGAFYALRSRWLACLAFQRFLAERIDPRSGRRAAPFRNTTR